MWKNRYVDIVSLLWWSYNKSNNGTNNNNNNDNDITVVYLVDPRGGSCLLNYIIIETNYACNIYSSINKSDKWKYGVTLENKIATGLKLQ